MPMESPLQAFYSFIFSELCLTERACAIAKTELSLLIEKSSMWDASSRELTKNHPLGWEKGDDKNTVIHSAKKLTLWDEPVSSVKLIEQRGVLTTVSFEILNQETSLLMSKTAFNKKASHWKTVLDEKFGTKGTVIAPISMAKVKHTRVAWNRENYVIILSANQSAKPDRLVLNFHEKEVGMDFAKLKGQQDAEFIQKQKDSNIAKKTEDSNPNNGNDPTASKDEKEIRKMIREISSRKAPKDISREVQKAVNKLNVYRYLSSVPYDVKADPDLINKAEQAAAICKKKNENSHGFGHWTDKCNLWRSTRPDFDLEESVMLYMRDNGSHNRERRGHRRWCLNHNMGKTGYGITSGFSAMYAYDKSGREIKNNYSYPGHGLYPIKYLHGSGWSYYIAKGKAPEKAKVEVWKLSKKEDKLPAWSKEPEGKKLPCKFVHIHNDTIVFEPQKDPVTKKGYYLVRIKGGNLKAQYLVKLF